MGAVATCSDVGHRHVEVVVVGNRGAARKLGHHAFAVADANLDLMRARRQNLLHGEIALGVDWHRHAHDVHALAGSDAAPRHGDRTAPHRDVADRQRIAVIDAEQIVGAVHAAAQIRELQLLRMRLVEAAFRVVDSQYVAHVVRSAIRDTPEASAAYNRHDGNRGCQARLALGQDQYLAPLQPERVAGVGRECDGLPFQGSIGCRQNVEATIRAHAVIADLHIGTCERGIDAMLPIRGSSATANGLAVDADPKRHAARRCKPAITASASCSLAGTVRLRSRWYLRSPIRRAPRLDGLLDGLLMLVECRIARARRGLLLPRRCRSALAYVVLRK